MALIPGSDHPEFKTPLILDFYRYPKFHAKLKKVLKISPGLRILDATAGFCKDAVIMANMGAEVLALERSDLIWALLEEAYQIQPIANLEIKKADALDYLEQLKNKSQATWPQIIYLDPMFPEHDKTALVKKEMRILREIVGTDPDAKNLLKAALTVALKRVVVKRANHDPYLGDIEPDFSSPGVRNRYDIYLSFHDRK
ncbi:MAG: class I SAM-dependent methyltransferase [Gammaproteobacteria bacterium]